MRSSFRKLLLIYFIGFLVLLNCLGVDKQSKPLMIAAAIQKAQSVMDRYPVETPPPLVYPDGTPLHDSVNSVYQISTKDGEDIVSFKESAETLKVLERENIEKIVTDFPKLFFAPKLTPQEVIDDAEDVDLGLPPKDRTLTADEKKKRIEEEILQLKLFHKETRSFIYDATPDELKNMRTNFTMAIAMFAELEDFLKANPDIDWEYFKTTIEYTIQSRMLVIDALTARGIVQ
jgi:hypothetical protein